MENSLYQLGLQDSVQLSYIDMITKDASVLATVPFYPTTHGFFNKFEKLVEVDAIEQMDFDSQFAEIGSKTSLGQTDLGKYGGKMTAGKDFIMSMYPGMPLKDAAIKYFGSKVAKITRATAEAIDFALIYNYIRSIAEANSKLQDAAGSNNENYSILCVRWEEGENCGLFNPAKKTLQDVLQIVETYLNNGGNLGNITKNGSTIPGFEFILETFFGFQLENTDFLSGVKNIDLTLTGSPALPKAPVTDIMLDKMLRDAKARSSNSFIYMHAAVKDYVSRTYAAQVTKAEMNFGNYSMNIVEWKGIPIVTSENFSDGLESNL